MDNQKLIKMAVCILNVYEPAKKDEEGAIFLTRKDIQFLLPNEYKTPISKILKFANFQDCSKRINNIAYRGTWAKDQTKNIDHAAILISKLNCTTNHEQGKNRLYLLNEEDVLNYIINNWFDFKQYMTEDLILEYNTHKFVNSSTFKKGKIVKLAGFKPTYTLFEENRSVAQPIVPKNKPKNKIDINKLMGRY